MDPPESERKSEPDRLLGSRVLDLGAAFEEPSLGEGPRLIAQRPLLIGRSALAEHGADRDRALHAGLHVGRRDEEPREVENAPLE